MMKRLKRTLNEEIKPQDLFKQCVGSNMQVTSFQSQELTDAYILALSFTAKADVVYKRWMAMFRQSLKSCQGSILEVSSYRIKENKYLLSLTFPKSSLGCMLYNLTRSRCSISLLQGITS